MNSGDLHECLRAVVADVAVTLLQACAYLPVPEPERAEAHDMNCPTCRLRHAAWGLADAWAERAALEQALLREVEWFIADAIVHAEAGDYPEWRGVIDAGERGLEALSQLRAE